MKEIEELKWCEPKEGKLDLTQDDGLEYLVKLADELWPYFEDDLYYDAVWNVRYEDDDEDHMNPIMSSVPNGNIDKKDFYRNSEVPSQFQWEYRHKIKDDPELKEQLNIYLANDFEDFDLHAALDAFGLDYRKFWYLCVAVKWLTQNYQKRGPRQLTYVENFRLLREQINKIVHENKKTEGLILGIVGEKHPLKITDIETLHAIGCALDSFLHCPLAERMNCPRQDYYIPELEDLPRDKGTRYSETRSLAYFAAIMDYFLDTLTPGNKPIKKRGVKYYKRDLVAVMMYILIKKDKYLHLSGRRKHLHDQISGEIKKVDPKDFRLHDKDFRT